MKRILLSVLGVPVLIVLACAESHACTCELPFPKMSLKQQVKKAHSKSRAVFSGKVIEIIRNPESYSMTVRFRVQDGWKGVSSDEVSLTTGRGGGDCGYSFEVGESYLVYAYGSGRNLETNICQRTARMSDAAADIRYLGKSKPQWKGKG